MCECEAHRALVDCTCSCDHRTDRAQQYREKAGRLEVEPAEAKATLVAAGELADKWAWYAAWSEEGGPGTGGPNRPVILWSAAAEHLRVALGATVPLLPIAELYSYEQMLDLLDDKERRLNAVHALIAKPTFKIGRLISADALREAVTNG